MEVKTNKGVLDYIDCGIVDNNCNTNYIVYTNMIHNFLLNSEETNSEFFFELLEQTNLIILKLFTHKNVELKDVFFVRRLILQSFEENNED